jgi:hypothetical protein
MFLLVEGSGVQTDAPSKNIDMLRRQSLSHKHPNWV